MRGRLIEIISVDRERNCLYVAHHNSDLPSSDASNAEWALDVIEEYLGFTLPDGYREPIIMFYWYRGFGPPIENKT